jgi:hypothetical protein
MPATEAGRRLAGDAAKDSAQVGPARKAGPLGNFLDSKIHAGPTGVGSLMRTFVTKRPIVSRRRLLFRRAVD